ncbi:MAG: glycosyltransferase family 4 protein [Candidatus Nezhaarchaeota archaeon]|nr:glycosyltransferase family 4 protein [Candidatus Nezhaarchaeota archaeon]
MYRGSVCNKVLVVSEQWWPEGTGGILASHLIAQDLRSAGFRLTVVHGTKGPIKVDGANYIYSGLLGARNKHGLWANCLILAKKAWFLKELRKSDVVYIPRYCYPIVPLAKKLGKRVVVHLHDYQPVSYNSVVLYGRGARSSFSKWLNVIDFEVLEHESVIRALLGALTSPLNRLCRIWLKEADVIICVSNRQADIIGSLAPELAGKLKVVYNPLPGMPLVEKSLGNPTFLYLGGDSYVKGFHIFLRSSRRILGKYRSLRFLIAGMLRKRGSRSIISVLNRRHENAYRLLGRVPHSEVSKLHAISYALIFPSICEEALPYAVMESMAAGTLPIASRVGGVPEIVEGSFAESLLFTPGDVDELADRMESVLSMSREQILNVGLKLRERLLKRFGNEETRKKLLEVFSL